MKFLRVILAIVLLSHSGASMALEVKNEYFTLSLPESWVAIESGDPEQWVFESERGQITISVVKMNAEKSDLERIARKLLDIRFETERKLRANPGMTEPWGTEHPDGTLQVNYLGRDESDSYFFFSGYVMPQATLSITGELTSSNQEEIQQLFQDVLSHLTF